jgi:hypothetical protein
MALIAGIVLGSAATEGLNVYRQSHNSRILQERLSCKTAGDAYIKENSTDSEVISLSLSKADYSPARNSCVAEVETTVWARTPLVTEKVVDLISGETLFSVNCNKDCGTTQEVWGDQAFDYVMKNASEPVELEKQYGRVQSTLAPESAPSSVTQWDAKGNPIPGAKHPPKSADHPSGR